MELIYGTGNAAKVKAMRNRLVTLGIKVTGYRELGLELPSVQEDGRTPLENARKKALRYYEELGRPVFSCDSGLYIDELPDELQPGIHVRTVNGKYLTDEEMQAYYSGLAEKYGRLTARYRNAICLVWSDGTIFEKMDDSLASEEFWMIARKHPKMNPGFPLDSLSVNPKTGSYYYDEEEHRLDQVAVEDGFLTFFSEVLRARNLKTELSE